MLPPHPATLSHFYMPHPVASNTIATVYVQDFNQIHRVLRNQLPALPCSPSLQPPSSGVSVNLAGPSAVTAGPSWRASDCPFVTGLDGSFMSHGLAEGVTYHMGMGHPCLSSLPVGHSVVPTFGPGSQGSYELGCPRSTGPQPATHWKQSFA